MKQLSKEQIKQRELVTAKLRDERDHLDEAIEDYNGAVSAAWDKLQTAIDDHTEATEEASAWIQEIKEAIESYIEGRSDKWRESDRASAYDDWLNAFDVFLDKADINSPEAVELELDDAADLIDELPQSVEG